MAGRDGKGSLRRRLRDHASGQMVNTFALYLFLATDRITHPAAGQTAVRVYIAERYAFRYAVAEDGAAAREMEAQPRASCDLLSTLARRAGPSAPVCELARTTGRHRSHHRGRREPPPSGGVISIMTVASSEPNSSCIAYLIVSLPTKPFSGE